MGGGVVSGSRGARAWGSGNESEREGRESFLVKRMGERGRRAAGEGAGESAALGRTGR